MKSKSDAAAFLSVIDGFTDISCFVFPFSIKYAPLQTSKYHTFSIPTERSVVNPLFSNYVRCGKETGGSRRALRLFQTPFFWAESTFLLEMQMVCVIIVTDESQYRQGRNRLITFELLSEKNFNANALDRFDRKHDVKRVYRKIGGEYTLVELPYVEDWSLEEKREAAEQISGDGTVAYLALDNETVAGFVALEKQLVQDYMILEMMYVSAPYRGSGLGRKLFDLGREEAKKAGAKALYISACSSEETIAFYKAMGAELTDRPIQKMAEAEPCDLQMVCIV